jgi:hypothetical protein
MARGPQRPRGMTDYEWRVYRRTGLTPSQARARGISLAAARGHAPRRLTPEGPVLREHQVREIRRAERGDLTERERRWARQQQKRTRIDVFAELRSYSPRKRAAIIKTQQYAAMRRRTSHGRFRWDIDAPAGAPVFPGSITGPGYYSRFLDEGDEGDEGYDEPDHDQYEDLDWGDFPDLEDVSPELMFYH